MHIQKVSSPEDFRKLIELRKTVLHPGGPFERVQYSADTSKDSTHLAVFDKNQTPIACGTLLMEADNEEHSHCIARIRGMAVGQEARGQGLGAMILDGLIKEAKLRGIRKVWCNARTQVLDFYLKRGFVSEGEEFITAGEIPHYKLVKTITYKE